MRMTFGFFLMLVHAPHENPTLCYERDLRLQHDGAGGFGGMLITSTEWTSRENWRHCLELFARYVMPEFQGSIRSAKRSWQKMMADSAAGKLSSPYGPNRESSSPDGPGRREA